MREGEAANPRPPPSGRRGRTKQNKALNLLDRLRTYADDVWRFATDPNVPFSNNIAEQAVRMPARSNRKSPVDFVLRTVSKPSVRCVPISRLSTSRMPTSLTHWSSLSKETLPSPVSSNRYFISQPPVPE
ncbi:MAG: IS66 family transposase [Methylococcales bacterium]